MHAATRLNLVSRDQGRNCCNLQIDAATLVIDIGSRRCVTEMGGLFAWLLGVGTAYVLLQAALSHVPGPKLQNPSTLLMQSPKNGPQKAEVRKHMPGPKMQFESHSRVGY